MLKGHVQIDLHNHNSGFTERYEQENMLTNAVKYMLGNCLNMRQNPYQLMLPLSTYGLGGIFLFDGRLTEDPDNVNFPSDVGLVGHAGQSQNTSLSTRGSLNTLESMRLDTGFQNVWDFNTSQANGTIASIALTNRQGGDYPFEFATEQNIMMSNFLAVPIAYDRTENTLYYRKDDKIFKTTVPTELVKVNDPYYGFTTSDADELVCTIGLSKGSSGYWEANNGYDGYMYVSYTGGNYNGDATVYYRRYRINDYSFAEEEERSFTLRNVQLYSTNWGNSSHQTIVACKGYLYLRSYTGQYFYIISVSNHEDIRRVDFEDSRYYTNIYPRYHGGINLTLQEPFNGSTRQAVIYLMPDGSYFNDHQCRGMNGTGILETDRLTCFRYYTGSGAHLNLSLTPWYLGSICNLSSPVVKTPSTDMKITYTLTDV